MKRRIGRMLSCMLALLLTLALAVPVSAYEVSDMEKLKEMDGIVIALADGANKAYIAGETVELAAPVYTTQVEKRDGVEETSDPAHPGFFETVMKSVTVFYAPLDLLEQAWGATVTYYGEGKQAVISFPEGAPVGEVSVGADGAVPGVNAGDGAMVFVDGKIVRLTDCVLYANNTIYVPVESFAQDVLGLFADASDGVVCISERFLTMTDGLSGALADLLGQAEEGLEAPDPVLVTENVPLLPATISSTGVYKTSIAVEEDLIGDGRDHEWNEWIPSGYDPDGEESVPMIILLHGNSSRGMKHAAKSYYRYLAELHNIILVWPTSSNAALDPTGESRGAPWTELFRTPDAENVDVQFLNGLIDYMLETYRVDPSKIYMGGFSNGDLMANRFASSEYGDRLAGLISGGGAVHYSSVWSGNPLEGAHEVLPVHNVPVYQHRGANDLSALTVNEFGDRNPHIIDPVAEGQKMASSNEYAKQVWITKNGASEIPVIRIQGINNYEVYEGENGAVIYQSIIGDPHADIINAPQMAYDNLICRYSRDPKTGALLDSGAAFTGDQGAVALVADAGNAFIDNRVVALVNEPFRRNGLIYAPLEVLEKGYGAQVTKTADGAELSVAGLQVRLKAGEAAAEVDGVRVALAGAVMEENGVLNVPAASFARSVLGLNATEKVDAVYLCDHAATISYSTYYTLYRILDPEDFGAFTAMSSIMGIPTTAKAGETVDLAANAVIFPTNTTKQLEDVVWSVYDAGTTGAVITGSVLTTKAPGTVQVTAMVERGTGTGTADISSRFLQNFDIMVMAAPAVTEDPAR